MADLRKAVVKGLAEDKGLYMPETIKTLPVEFYNDIASMSFRDIAYNVASAFFGEDVDGDALQDIVYDTLSFDCPVVKVTDNIYSLELFHGPTLAFKDVGARFMARLLQYFIRGERSEARGEVNVLVATTIIENGVDMPNVNTLIVENADRFGLSTLHQLRGRVGRSDKAAYCILVSSSRSEVALQRMKMMCESSDGFELAEADLKLRGPGDFFGTRQHGIPSLRAANLYTDIAIASEACEAVNKVFEEKTEEASVLYNAIASMFELRFGRKIRFNGAAEEGTDRKYYRACHEGKLIAVVYPSLE